MTPQPSAGRTPSTTAAYALKISPPRDPGHGPVGVLTRQTQLAARLRASGCTWVQIAAELAREFDLNQLAAMRLAHGWSQRELADQWHRRWPDDRKTNKSISNWERWSAGEATGHAPMLSTLARLAELFECALTDLLGSYGDFRHYDRAGTGDQVDGHHQYALGQVCPHGCTVLVYVPAPNGDGASG